MVVLLKSDMTYSLYEVKYKKNPLSKREMFKEIKQIDLSIGITIGEIGFVCSSKF